MVTFGALGVHFGTLWKVSGFILSSLGVIWMPRASKIDTTSDLADIAETYENHVFFVGFGGLEAGQCSNWKLGGALG